MGKYINIILKLCCVFMLFYIMYNQKTKIKTLESVNKELTLKYDSIKSEQFVLRINQQRFELIIDRAEAEMSPDCKEEFEKLLHETE